jgi:hypothetical protein
MFLLEGGAHQDLREGAKVVRFKWSHHDLRHLCFCSQADTLWLRSYNAHKKVFLALGLSSACISKGLPPSHPACHLKAFLNQRVKACCCKNRDGNIVDTPRVGPYPICQGLFALSAWVECNKVLGLAKAGQGAVQVKSKQGKNRRVRACLTKKSNTSTFRTRWPLVSLN